VRLLVDTHALLWFLAGNREIGRDARRAIERAESAYVSAVTIWEIAMKRAAGRLIAPVLLDRLTESGFAPLAIEWEHAEVAGSLPHHHRDPFDRMLVAQATVERLTIVTRDRAIALYDVPILAA
jgi:PIN domain nuclease of toxin-antitoxin system